MKLSEMLTPRNVGKDLVSGVVVFLVALPLCLGIAVASGAPPIAGLIAGIVGGLVIGPISGSHTAVSGPAAGLTAIVAAQIANLGTFDTFLLAVVIGGVIQVGLGIARAGSLSAFFPSSVIKGLLAAIGVILILKQVPHLLGHDQDPEGEMSFFQPDGETTFSEIVSAIADRVHTGAIVIGIASLLFLIFWERIKPLKKLIIPAPLVVVVLAMIVGQIFEGIGGPWHIQASHMVTLPKGIDTFFQLPNFGGLLNPAVYIGGITIAIVASLETLLNLEAVDRLDPRQRNTPASRELFAQGVGNIVCGMVGGLPTTAVVIRGTVNVNSGAQTKMSTIFHGAFLLVCVVLFPMYLEMIPLSALAAILVLTGFKLASPKLFRQMWREGRYQFLPFIITVVAIVLTDLLIGIVIGLCVALVFILVSNLRRPIRRIVEKHVGGEVYHIELANQVSFLNRAALERSLREAPSGSHVLLDARRTDYIDPDVLSLIREFHDVVAPAHGVKVSLRGFRSKYHLEDGVQFVDYTTRELQEKLTPNAVIQLLQEGNDRFREGRSLDRDLKRQLREEIVNQHPMAVLISGIHSRIPAELIFDLGLGDILSIRVGGNVVGPKVIGCTEYGCAVAGARLVLVMGHTGSAMVTAAVSYVCGPPQENFIDECPSLMPVIERICESIQPDECARFHNASNKEKAVFIDMIAKRNVLHSVKKIVDESDVIRRLVEEQKVAVVGAMYDIATGKIEFFMDEAIGLTKKEVAVETV